MLLDQDDGARDLSRRNLVFEKMAENLKLFRRWRIRFSSADGCADA
ncbi:MAG: hypothetical protein WA677_21220 [Bradyrhizobium sp.]